MPQAIHELKVQFATALPSIYEPKAQFIIKKQGGLKNQIVLFTFSFGCGIITLINIGKGAFYVQNCETNL